MRVAMISARKAQLAAVQAGLEQRGARVDRFGDGYSFLRTLPSRNWELVILDGLHVPFRDLLERLLAVDASLNTAVIGEWLRSAGPIHLLHTTLEQGGLVRASARAKFLEGTPDQPRQPLQPGAGLRHLLSQARKRLT